MLEVLISPARVAEFFANGIEHESLFAIPVETPTSVYAKPPMRDSRVFGAGNVLWVHMVRATPNLSFVAPDGSLLGGDWACLWLGSFLNDCLKIAHTPSRGDVLIDGATPVTLMKKHRTFLSGCAWS